jgi:hypothetical protein
LPPLSMKVNPIVSPRMAIPEMVTIMPNTSEYTQYESPNISRLNKGAEGISNNAYRNIKSWFLYLKKKFPILIMCCF